MVLLLAFQRFDLANWGVIESLQPYEQYGYPAFNVDFRDAGLVVTACQMPDLHHQHNLTGRCTRVYGSMGAMDDKGLSLSTNADIGQAIRDMKLALKLYWPELSSVNEADIIERAHRLGNSNAAIKDHIPELLAAYEHVYSTGEIRRRLGIDTLNDKLHGPRVLRILLFKFLKPLDPEVLSMNDFMHGWKQTLICT